MLPNLLWTAAFLVGWIALSLDGAIAGVGKEKPNDDDAVVTLEKLVNIDGTLEESDPKDKKTKGPAKAYSFRLVKGKAYIIDLMSDDFDAFLRVEDAGGKELAWDDDSGKGLNSRLRFEPVTDGTYKLIATSLDQKTGKFQLKVRPLEPGKESIPAARDVDKVGFTIQDKLSKGDPGDPALKGRPRKVQPVKLKAGKTYTIDLISDEFDAFLRLENPKGKEVARDDDSGGDLNARIVYECKEDGEFRIIMTTLDGQVGNFTLKVREE